LPGWAGCCAVKGLVPHALSIGCIYFIWISRFLQAKNRCLYQDIDLFSVYGYEKSDYVIKTVPSCAKHISFVPSETNFIEKALADASAFFWYPLRV